VADQPGPDRRPRRGREQTRPKVTPAYLSPWLALETDPAILMYSYSGKAEVHFVGASDVFDGPGRPSRATVRQTPLAERKC
jgi:hypothetical protein